MENTTDKIIHYILYLFENSFNVGKVKKIFLIV